MPNRFTPIQPGQSMEQMIAIINKNFAELDQEGVKKLYKGTDGLPSILIDGTVPVIKVAPEGTDVTTADDTDLNFNSAQNVFKIVQKGTVSFTFDAAFTTTVEISHELGYAPIVWAFITDGSTYNIPLPWFDGISDGGAFVNLNRWLVVNSTADAIYFQGYDAVGSGAGPYQITYYLLQESVT